LVEINNHLRVVRSNSRYLCKPIKLVLGIPPVDPRCVWINFRIEDKLQLLSAGFGGDLDLEL